jgi:hydrogenase expression/formation protein HypC
VCLGIPMRVETIDGLVAHCEFRGQQRSASLLMMQHENITEGDYVMIHLGHVMQRMTEDEAMQAWALYDEMLCDMNADPPAL